MKRKLTVIYNSRWSSGGNQHCLTKHTRIEVDKNLPIMPQVINEVGTEDIVFLFEGWPNHIDEQQ